MIDLGDLPAHAPWALYLLVLAGPFVQEDTTILGAATLSANQHGEPALLFVAVLIGLTAADISKYWLGAVLPQKTLLKNERTRARVESARSTVLQNLIKALLAARFVPGARIPTYMACGLFGADFKRFAIILTLAGAFYVALAFGLVAALGQAGSPYLTIGAPLLLVASALIGIAAHLLHRPKTQTSETYA